MVRMVSGDGYAFATLFHRYRRPVYRFARQMGATRELAEDIAQEVFIALMSSGSRFDPRLGTITTYLYGITRNLLRRRLRRTTSHPEVDLGTARPEASSEAAAMDAELEREQALQALRQAIATLPTHYREVIVLCELHELSYEDAARVVGCPVGTIRSRLNRARRLLTERCRGASRTVTSDPETPSLRARRCLA